MTTKKTRRALGRSLSNLIPILDEEKGVEHEIIDLEIVSILPNPFQPRKTFNDDDIRDLADSIKNQGLIQPIVIRRNAKKYEIVSGERRLRACKTLGWIKVPCIIKEQISDTKMLEMALVENIQRENLNEIEIAESYQALLFNCGLSHQQLSEQVGKSRSVITNTLRLLKLPQQIQNSVRTGILTAGHARALCAIEDQKKQLMLANKIVAENLTVRDIERLNKGESDKKKINLHSSLQKKGGLTPDVELLSQQEQLRYRFGTEVKMVMQSQEKGKIEIYYYNHEDLNRILQLLLSK